MFIWTEFSRQKGGEDKMFPDRTGPKLLTSWDNMPNAASDALICQPLLLSLPGLEKGTGSAEEKRHSSPPLPSPLLLFFCPISSPFSNPGSEIRRRCSEGEWADGGGHSLPIHCLRQLFQLVSWTGRPCFLFPPSQDLLLCFHSIVLNPLCSCFGALALQETTQFQQSGWWMMI